MHTDSLRVSFGPWRDRRHGLDSSENPSPENVAAVAIELSPAELERLSAVAPQGAAVGDRYADMSTVNRQNVGTETRFLGQKASHAVRAATKKPGFYPYCIDTLGRSIS